MQSSHLNNEEKVHIWTNLSPSFSSSSTCSLWILHQFLLLIRSTVDRSSFSLCIIQQREKGNVCVCVREGDSFLPIWSRHSPISQYEAELVDLGYCVARPEQPECRANGSPALVFHSVQKICSVTSLWSSSFSLSIMDPSKKNRVKLWKYNVYWLFVCLSLCLCLLDVVIENTFQTVPLLNYYRLQA